MADSRFVRFLEAIPVVGYGASLVHVLRDDEDRAKRAAAKCTGSTFRSAYALGGAGLVLASGGTLLPVVAGAVGVGAVGGLTSTVYEGAIAETIRDPNIRADCDNLNDPRAFRRNMLLGSVTALSGLISPTLTAIKTHRDSPISMGYAIVYIWMPQDKNLGHSSMELEDGTYISWWPAGKGKDSVGDLNWVVSPATTNPSVQADIASEDGRQPVRYRIHNINVAKVKDWWSRNDRGTYIVLTKNCCDIVLDALWEGGKGVTIVSPICHPENLAAALDKKYNTY